MNGGESNYWVYDTIYLLSSCFLVFSEVCSQVHILEYVFPSWIRAERAEMIIF